MSVTTSSSSGVWTSLWMDMYQHPLESRQLDFFRMMVYSGLWSVSTVNLVRYA